MSTTQELIAELDSTRGSLETERSTVEGLKAETVSRSQVIASLIESAMILSGGCSTTVKPQA